MIKQRESLIGFGSTYIDYWRYNFEDQFCRYAQSDLGQDIVDHRLVKIQLWRLILQVLVSLEQRSWPWEFIFPRWLLRISREMALKSFQNQIEDYTKRGWIMWVTIGLRFCDEFGWWHCISAIQDCRVGRIEFVLDFGLQIHLAHLAKWKHISLDHTTKSMNTLRTHQYWEMSSWRTKGIKRNKN